MTNRLRQILIAAREREAHLREQWSPAEAWVPAPVPGVFAQQRKTRRTTVHDWNYAIDFGRDEIDDRSHTS